MTHKPMIAVSAVQYVDKDGKRAVANPGETFYVAEKHVEALAENGSAKSVAEAAKSVAEAAKAEKPSRAKGGQKAEGAEPDDMVG